MRKQIQVKNRNSVSLFKILFAVNGLYILFFTLIYGFYATTPKVNEYYIPSRDDLQDMFESRSAEDNALFLHTYIIKAEESLHDHNQVIGRMFFFQLVYFVCVQIIFYVVMGREKAWFSVAKGGAS
jgi:hypothetical protein